MPAYEKPPASPGDVYLFIKDMTALIDCHFSLCNERKNKKSWVSRSEISENQGLGLHPNFKNNVVQAEPVENSYYSDDAELNYESLVKKPDMILTTVMNSNGMRRKDIVSEGKIFTSSDRLIATEVANLKKLTLCMQLTQK